MDLAIIAGLGMIGSYMVNNNDVKKEVEEIEDNENKIRLFPSNYNSKTKHVYDTNSVPQLNKKFYDMAAIQADKSKNPAITNILTPFIQPYENVKQDEIIMGPVPVSELLNNDNFTNQFDLQKVDNKEPFSIGENIKKSLFDKNDFSPFDNKTNNMTYNIINKEQFTHNNMQAFTAKRDDETNESNNFEYKMDIFSGASKNWFPKKEAPIFFKPQENIQSPFGSALVSELERDRIVQSRVKQNERPFEPIKTAPGLNLDYNQQPQTGFHDTYREMPRDTNELRPANRPKLTFEDRIKGGPRKGEKRGITTSVIKRRPLHWRHQGFEDLVPNKAITTRQTDPGNYIIPDNARLRSGELFGPSQGPSLVGPYNREGKVKISKRVKHIEDKLGPTATKRINQNTKSYNILLNERNTTNYDIRQGPNNKNQNIATFNPNDIARQTIKEINTSSQFNTHQGSNQRNPISNFTDKSKSTLREILAILELNTNMGTNQKNPISNLSDEAKQTFRQILTNIQTNTHIGTNQKENVSNLLDIAKTTVRELLTKIEFNNNMQSGQKEVLTNLQDEAKSTTRQTLSNSEFNTFIGKTMSDYCNLCDTAKETIKQILAIQPLETIMSCAQNNSYSNIQDDVKQTIRQLLTLEQFNNNVRQNIGSYSNISDEAKHTLKQLLSIIQTNTNIKSANKSTYTELSDLAKSTIKEFISTIQLNNNMGTIKKEVAFDMNDLAKTTHKQDLLNEKYIGTMINQNIGSTQTNYDLLPTMKDITKIINYTSAATSVGVNNQPTSQKDIRNMRQNTAKEQIAKGHYPTLSGPKFIPVKEQYNSMLQKDKPNFTRANAPVLTGKIDLNDRTYFNSENQKTIPSYDDRLYNELLNQFDENPLINNPQSTTGAKFVS